MNQYEVRLRSYLIKALPAQVQPPIRVFNLDSRSRACILTAAHTLHENLTPSSIRYDIRYTIYLQIAILESSVTHLVLGIIIIIIIIIIAC